MRNKVPRIGSLERALAMLETVVADGGQSSVAELARRVGMPVATAHRQVATLVDKGYLRANERNRYLAGPGLLKLLQQLDDKQLIANAAAPCLHELASSLHGVVQLGTFENDMVTYRIKTGQGANDLFTKIGMQLEAYCSGIGKVLLAHLPESQLRAYLSAGPFVPLTDATITSADALWQELKLVRERGFAVDDGEIAEGLRCVAVPVRSPDGTVSAAISASCADGREKAAIIQQWLPLLAGAAQQIEQLAFGQID